MKNTTIAAISTPVYISSTGVVRLSGEDAFLILSKIFKSAFSKSVLEAKGYTSMYGRVFDENGEDVDEAVVAFFRAPLSYTGEDVVEISCHGGIYLVKKVLSLLLANGATLAKEGEFTKRAVLNGKMTVTEAEAVVDLINSVDRNSSKIAMMGRNGTLFKSLSDIKGEILGVLSHLSAFIDYPDEDIDEVSKTALLDKVDAILAKMLTIINTYDVGSIIKTGVDTAIVGKANVGKSSLMNCLSKEEKSIVTDIAGTTRDIIQNTIKLPNVILNLNDTAGIRTTDDVVEKIGTQLSVKKIESASLVIAVFDASSPLDEDDFNVINAINNTISIAVLNKADKPLVLDCEVIEKNFKHIVKASTKTGEGIEELLEIIEEVLQVNNVDMSLGVLANERQKNIADILYKSLKNARKTIFENEFLDVIAFELEDALKNLMELTGENASQAMIDGIFSRFCVGK